MARGCWSVVRMPPARESKDVTISPLCLKGDGGGLGQRRFWGKAVAASRVSRAAESNSRDVLRMGDTFVLLVKRRVDDYGVREGRTPWPRLAERWRGSFRTSAVNTLNLCLNKKDGKNSPAPARSAPPGWQ